jgi:hypothetical protein
MSVGVSPHVAATEAYRLGWDGRGSVHENCTNPTEKLRNTPLRRIAPLGLRSKSVDPEVATQ